MAINKYNLDWQIARLKARSIKDVNQKAAYVLRFFMGFKSEQMRVRVFNWANMAKLGYSKESSGRARLDRLAIIMKNWKGKVSYETEEDHNFEAYDNDTLQKLYKDLKARTWGFQYAKAPKDHNEFMKKLKEYLDGKKEI